MPPDDIPQSVFARAAREPALLSKLRESVADSDQPCSEVDQVSVSLVPVQPGQGVVLAVGIVVSRLGSAKFVAALKHRHALRQEQRCEQGALKILAPVPYCWVMAFALNTAVPRVIVVVSVVVVLAVKFIVLVLIADEITQGEPIMRRDEVDPGKR